MFQKQTKLKPTYSMLPPWIQYPIIPAYSIGWRLGGAPDEYLAEFKRWWGTLDETQKTTYREIYPAPESWRAFCRQTGVQFFYESQLDEPKETTTITLTKGPTLFYAIFKEAEGIEDVIRCVSTFVRKYETGRDQFWLHAETALLTALCIRIFLFEEKKHYKEALESYLHDLRESDRRTRNAPADKIFADWKEVWPDDEAIKAYDIFLQLPPETQTKAIAGVQSLFIIENIEARTASSNKP